MSARPVGSTCVWSPASSSSRLRAGRGAGRLVGRPHEPVLGRRPRPGRRRRAAGRRPAQRRVRLPAGATGYVPATTVSPARPLNRPIGAGELVPALGLGCRPTATTVTIPLGGDNAPEDQRRPADHGLGVDQALPVGHRAGRRGRAGRADRARRRARCQRRRGRDRAGQPRHWPSGSSRRSRSTAACCGPASSTGTGRRHPTRQRCPTSVAARRAVREAAGPDRGRRARWEAGLVLALDGGEHRRHDRAPLRRHRRAAGGGRVRQAQAALLAAGLARLDADAVDRLTRPGSSPSGCIRRDDADGRGAAARTRDRVTSSPADADPEGDRVGRRGRRRAARPTRRRRPRPPDGLRAASATRPRANGSTDRFAPSDPVDELPPAGARSSPSGARPARPGRTTVAVTVADELARLGSTSLLIDADVYGGVVGAGARPARRVGRAGRRLPAGRRQPGSTRTTLAAAVLAGAADLSGADRHPAGRALARAAAERAASVLAAARGLADFVVVDCGFCLESDEELSFDSLAPRRNGATLAILDAADLMLVVGAADPVGSAATGARPDRAARRRGERDQLGGAEQGARPVSCPATRPPSWRAALQRFTGRVPAALLPLRPASGRRRARRRQDAGRGAAEQPAAARARRARGQPSPGSRRPVPRRHRAATPEP